MKIKITIFSLLAGLFVLSSAHGYTKEKIEKRGRLLCGVSTGSPGFSMVDADGRWTGLDIDICRAVATVVLGDSEQVDFLPLSESESYVALLSGEVDLLSKHSVWTFTPDVVLGVNFVGVSYYDGQGLLVATDLGVNSIRELKKVRICNPVGSAFEENLKDHFKQQSTEYKLVPYDTVDLAIKGFEQNSCDVVSMQQSQLYGIRMGLANPDSGVVLAGVISREPLSPVVRQGDDVWFNIVKWALYAMVNGEELGVSSYNVEEMKISNRFSIRKFFTQGGAAMKGIGLQDDWAGQVIKQVGNYGEVFEKNFGPDSPVHIERGLNKLWKDGGLQYAPPIR